MRITTPIAAGILVLAASVERVGAQQQPTPVARITLDEARKAVDAAEAEARRNGWNLVLVVSDAEGTPIYLRRMDGAQKRNYDNAMNKISTSIRSGMHTADYVAGVRAGTVKPIEGALEFDGGLLLRRNGQVVGAFSASGARGTDDAQAVRAGMAAIGIQPGGESADKPAQQPTAAVRVPAEVLDRYVGEYESDSGQLLVTVRREGEMLLGQPTGASQAVPLVPISNTRFKVGASAAEVEFVTDAAGVMHKVLYQGGQEIRARRRASK